MNVSVQWNVRLRIFMLKQKISCPMCLQDIRSPQKEFCQILHPTFEMSSVSHAALPVNGIGCIYLFLFFCLLRSCKPRSLDVSLEVRGNMCFKAPLCPPCFADLLFYRGSSRFLAKHMFLLFFCLERIAVFVWVQRIFNTAMTGPTSPYVKSCSI